MSTYDRPQAPRRTGRKITSAGGASGSPPILNRTAGGRRAISTGGAILIITVGAILLFALTADASPDWINLRVVGVILILAGVAGLSLPRMRRTPTGGFRRWVLPMLPAEEEPPGPDEMNLVRRNDTADGDYPTLADELLREEHDPPIADSPEARP